MEPDPLPRGAAELVGGMVFENATATWLVDRWKQRRPDYADVTNGAGLVAVVILAYLFIRVNHLQRTRDIVHYVQAPAQPHAPHAAP